MIGPAGSGKNHMINTIKRFPELGMPLTTYDCSQLTAAGFTGDSTEDIFQKYKDENRAENTPAKYGIIYLDEIDKIINTHYDSQDENCNAFVQQQLLSALAGTEKFETIDTSKILFWEELLHAYTTWKNTRQKQLDFIQIHRRWLI